MSLRGILGLLEEPVLRDQLFFTSRNPGDGIAKGLDYERVDRHRMFVDELLPDLALHGGVGSIHKDTTYRSELSAEVYHLSLYVHHGLPELFGLWRVR